MPTPCATASSATNRANAASASPPTSAAGSTWRYNPAHAFGCFSTFNADAIRDMSLHKGAYPANYGGRLGAVLDVANKDGNRNHFAAGSGVSLIAARTTLEGPLGNGSWIFSGRRTHLEPVLAAMRRAGENVPDSTSTTSTSSSTRIAALRKQHPRSRPEGQLRPFSRAGAHRQKRSLITSYGFDYNQEFNYESQFAVALAPRHPMLSFLDAETRAEVLETTAHGSTSPPIELTEGRIRLPWFAIVYSGRHLIRLYALDTNWYDYIRSNGVDTDNTWGGLAGDSFDQPIFHVEGGIGLFASAAVDSLGMVVLPR